MLHDVNGSILGQLIDFSYTRHISINAENVEDILTAADYFEMLEIVKLCESFYLDRLAIPNALAYLTTAEKYALIDLKKAAQELVYHRFLELVEDESFLQLDVDSVEQYLRSNNIIVDSEEDVFGVIEEWIEFDRENRKSHFLMLMGTVRMTRISSEVC